MKKMKALFLFILLILSLNASAQYYTGQKVFAKKFPTEIKDYSQDTYISITNADGDIIVAIEDISTGKVIQHAYIKSRDIFKFEHIPVGRFMCKYMWTDINGNRNFARDDGNMEFKVEEYGGYEIIMKSTTGNLTQTNISESDFFN
jgi:hypothetical protein